MMGIGISLDIPDVPLLAPQPPLRGTRLRTALLNYGGNLIRGNRCGIGLRKPTSRSRWATPAAPTCTLSA